MWSSTRSAYIKDTRAAGLTHTSMPSYLQHLLWDKIGKNWQRWTKLEDSRKNIEGIQLSILWASATKSKKVGMRPTWIQNTILVQNFKEKSGQKEDQIFFVVLLRQKCTNVLIPTWRRAVKYKCQHWFFFCPVARWPFGEFLYREIFWGLDFVLAKLLCVILMYINFSRWIL